MKQYFLTPVFCLTLLVGAAQAQGLPTLSKLEISLWPEYDWPGVLVIYRGQFAADTPLPVAVEIRIPARIGQPHAVAHKAGDGQLFEQEYETRIEGEWLVVSFDLPTSSFQLEYYDKLPVDESGRRTYTFAYVADYPVAALNLDVQMPATAEGFFLDPAAPLAVQETDGLFYHLVRAGPLDQGERKSWTFTYRKANSSLSVEVMGLVPTETSAPSAAKGSAIPAGFTVLVVLAAVAGAGVAAFWLGRRTQPAAKPESPPSASARALFCHQCGAQLRPDSKFCHNCGTIVNRQS